MALRILWIPVIFQLLFISLPGEAQVPPLVHYQGRLFQISTGEPEEGLVAFQFRLVDTRTGEPEVEYWSETQDILVENGFYEVELGKTTPIPSEIFSATAVYLDIRVLPDDWMSPRQRILAVPYALQADLLDGLDSSDLVASTSLEIHVVDPSAHHTKTVRADEITSGVFSVDRIPLAIARQSDLEAHTDNFNNPHKVTLQQAGTETSHDTLLGAAGHLNHTAIDAHILGQVAGSTTPLYDHSCPEDMVQVGYSCIDKDLFQHNGQALTATWFEAAVKCSEQKKRLCRISEWYVGCADRENLNISDIGNSQEWVDQWTSEGTEANLRPVAAGQGSCQTMRRWTSSGTLPFRCCR